MNSDKPDTPRNIDPQAGADLIVAGVMEVVNAALAVGATIAKSIAQETSGGKPVSRPSSEDSALNEMIHYGVAAVTQVVGLVVSGAGVVSQTVQPSAPSTNPSPSTSSPVPARAEADQFRQGDRPPAPPPSPTPRATSASLPTVHQGATLRMPLSIENPGNEPMTDMTFVCRSLTGEVGGSGTLLEVGAVRFQPETLAIAAKDFEKLTVFIETQAETAVGHYQAVIGIGPNQFETLLQFQVISSDPLTAPNGVAT